MSRKEKLEWVGSICWFFMDGFWMVGWMPVAYFFGAIVVVIIGMGISPIAMRRIRLGSRHE